MNQPPDQPNLLGRAAYRRRRLTARSANTPIGADRMVAKPSDSDPHRLDFEMLGRPQ